MDSGLGLKV